MQLAAAGMLEAYAEVVRRHQTVVRKFCARMLGAERADDAAQDVFLEVWRTRDRYDSKGRLRPFLFTCARNRCLRALRDRRPTTELDDNRLVADADQLDALLRAERQRRIDSGLERLSPKLREAIALRFSAGLDYREIAATIRRPEETVRSRIFLALKRLREVLGDDVRERSLP